MKSDAAPASPAPVDLRRLVDTALAAGCREAEAFLEHYVQTPVTLRKSEPAMLESTEGFLVSLRVISDSRVGFAVTGRPGDYDVVARAMRSAGFGPRAEFGFADPRLSEAATLVETYDPELEPERLTTQRLADMAWEVIEAGRAAQDQGMITARLQRWVGGMRLVNSRGVDVSFRRTYIALHASGECNVGGRIVRVLKAETAGRLGDLNLARLKTELQNSLMAVRFEARPGGGRRRVLFAPQAVSDLLGPVSAAVGGQAFVRGVSPWRNAVGQQVVAPEISLVDDATMPFGPASAPYDDEGVATRSTPIIEKGVFRSALMDLQSAAALKASPTGHGYRRGSNPPAAGRSNWRLEEGSRSLESLRADLGEGLVIESLMGASAGNLLGGDVSGTVLEGYLARGGESVGHLRHCLIRVNAFEALRTQIAGVSRERRWSLSNVLAPHLLIDGVDIVTGT